MKRLFIFTVVVSFSTQLMHSQIKQDVPLSFEMYEIHIFQGLTLEGSSAIKIDRSGLSIIRSDSTGRKSTTRVDYLAIEEDDLTSFRVNFGDLLNF